MLLFSAHDSYSQGRDRSKFRQINDTSITELEKLFKNITEITIPLPFSTETIFGPPTINLKINGVIDITGSYQRTYSDQVSTTDQTNTQNNINFKQEVQVTTKGTIGDKLTI